jgi:hypothetical protein
MANLFISYAGTDVDAARLVEECLIEKGHRVRIAVAAAVAGNWRMKFSRALATADALIVVLGQAALGSKNVVGEIGAGRVLEFVRGTLMLPVLVGDTPIPEFISDVYCFRLKSVDQESVERVAEQLDRAIVDNSRISPRLFISHRHRDKPIAAALVQLISKAFHIGRNDIRCTSVAPYMLTPGERTSEQLRSDIAGAELVIGLLSPDAYESNYVLCELGASWGRDVATFPVLVRGATFADVPAPFNERHSVSLEREEECLQLLDYIASKTTLSRREQPEQDLSGLAKQLAVEAKQQVPVRPEWVHLHTATYTGPVWTKLRTCNGRLPVTQHIFIQWGDYVYAAELTIAPGAHVYLTHEKTKADLVPINVRVSPPCEVSFGQGPPPEQPAFEIRSGWRQLEHPAGG